MKTNDENKKEIQKVYYRERNKNIFKIRFSATERALLQDMMEKDGWLNMSSFIRYKLFGFKIDEELKKMIDRKNPESIGRLLKLQMLELARTFEYLSYRYDKDMAQLYREEGVNLQDWIDATNSSHHALISRFNDMFVLLRMIAKKLDLEDYFVMETESSAIDMETATKEELDELARQIRLEQIALGLPNTFD